MNGIIVKGCNTSRIGNYRLFIPESELPTFQAKLQSITDPKKLRCIDLEEAIDSAREYGTGKALHCTSTNPTGVDIEIYLVNGGIEAVITPIDGEGRKTAVDIARILGVAEQLRVAYEQSLSQIARYPKESEGPQLLEMIGALDTPSQ